MKTNVSVRVINPKGLSEWDFERLNEVSQDMWAQSIWELVQCKCCQKMMSKQDIFWHLEKEIYDETVKKILQILGISEISCVECSGKTRFIYPDEHVENIKERLLQSEESFLVVCENNAWEIVWYEEWYIDCLENIFSREFAYHYEKVGLWEIQQRVQSILWYYPEKMFVLSSIWLIHKYSSFFTLFELFKYFAIHIPEKHNELHGISELDKNNNLNFLSSCMGNISLGIYENEDLRKKIVNTGKNYKSNLVLIENIVSKYKYFLSGWVKNFLKLTKK